jgi:hypothetical protein
MGNIRSALTGFIGKSVDAKTPSLRRPLIRWGSPR